MSAKKDQAHSAERHVSEVVRGFSGAFLFGTPLLFTMEMWWIGMYANTWKLLAFLLTAFLVNVHLCYFAGFRRQNCQPVFASAAQEALEAVTIGAVGAAALLLVLNRIKWGDPLDSVVGKIVIQMVPMSIGAAASNLVFAPGEDRQGDDQEQYNGSSPGVWHMILNDLGATVAGGIFIGFSIAPTEEVPMLAAEMSVWHLLALVALSLLVTYLIVFASGFDPQTHPREAPLQGAMAETLFAYVVSLAVAWVSLYLFDRIQIGEDPLYSVIAQMIVLAFPASVGGAGGRLVI